MKLRKRGIIVCLVLMGSIILTKSGWVSNTYAAIKELLDPSDTVVNEFKGGVDIEIEENFDEEGAKNWDGTALVKEVTVKNNRETPALIRVSIVPIWLDENNKPWAGDINAIVLNKNIVSNPNEEGWMDGKDGYFYYTKALDTGAGTNKTIIDEVSFDINKIPENQRDIYKNKKLVVRSNDKVVLEKKRLHMIPSEMESINIKTDILKNITGNITVSVEEA